MLKNWIVNKRKYSQYKQPEAGQNKFHTKNTKYIAYAKKPQCSLLAEIYLNYINCPIIVMIIFTVIYIYIDIFIECSVVLSNTGPYNNKIIRQTIKVTQIGLGNSTAMAVCTEHCTL